MNSLIYRKNTLGYLFWRWLISDNGKFISWLDACYFGPSRGLNMYNKIAKQYSLSNIKPDKLYSILPTVLMLTGDISGKVVSDFGCGSGFFTVQLAMRNPKIVFGIDNSQAQLDLASKISLGNLRYLNRDFFIGPIPRSDVMVVPFVLNYARTKVMLKHFLDQLFMSLHDGGKIILVVDLPSGRSLERFGAKKKFINKVADEEEIAIVLFSLSGEEICTLKAIYYTPETIEALLIQVGFENITWHQPLISDEGKHIMGDNFWKGYASNSELGYVTGYK